MEAILPSTIPTSSQDTVTINRLHPSAKHVNRKLKAHKKSRRGCGNCKLRRVKCDESKPGCEKCTSFGVLCNYDCRHSDLQLSVSGPARMETLQILPYSLKQILPSTIVTSSKGQTTGALKNRIAIYDFGEQDLELLNKFHTRTVFTITTDKNLHSYQTETVKLACSHPFLMHGLLSLTQMHDRYLSAAPNPRLSTTEAFHWYQAIALFNHKISGPIQPSERDAVYATAVCLGVIAFFYIEANSPEEAWPLKPPSSLDLTWLTLSDGKKELRRATQPDGPPQSLIPFEPTSPSPSPSHSSLDALPPAFLRLCGLTPTITTNKNPYHAAASALATSLHSTCKLSTTLNFLSFISTMSPSYKRLLERKDPAALLLLAYWYAKMCQLPHWWILRRATLEGRAIVLFLDRVWGDDDGVRDLLLFPRVVCGVVA